MRTLECLLIALSLAACGKPSAGKRPRPQTATEVAPAPGSVLALEATDRTARVLAMSACDDPPPSKRTELCESSNETTRAGQAPMNSCGEGPIVAAVGIVAGAVVATRDATKPAEQPPAPPPLLVSCGAPIVGLAVTLELPSGAELRAITAKDGVASFELPADLPPGVARARAGALSSAPVEIPPRK